MTKAGAVPESITFGFRVLEIPTLDEMGIPMAGLGFCRLAEGIGEYASDPASCWIPRGAPLLSYLFRFYTSETRSRFSLFVQDKTWSQSFEIRSPISGLLLMNRQEATVGGIPGMSLQYEWCEERRLPVLLVPNDEAPADTSAFYVYDEIADVVRRQFDLLPYRDRSRTSPERLRDWLTGLGSESAKYYEERRRTLQSRNRDSFRQFRVRDITKADFELIRSVQDLRGRDVRLRDKLVHLARQFSESV